MSRTAMEAGWHRSRYNLSARIPETDKVAVVNLLKGSCAAYSPAEYFLLSVVDELDEDHPILKLFADRGLIVNYDEQAMLETRGKAAGGFPMNVGLTICPTLGCNFDCPYCFEKHHAGKMSPKVQDELVSFAARMLDTSGTKKFNVNWFGGEPLLVPEIIESLSERFIKLAEERNAEYRASIITNGYLLTQDIVDMLARVKVVWAQVTLDGVGAAHDATRHLAGGGPTFDRITENLRSLKIPFFVNIRHNIHTENYVEYEKVKACIQAISEESGNRMSVYPTAVRGNTVLRERDDRPDLIFGSESALVGIRHDVRRVHKTNGRYCLAQNLWCMAIDEEGRLYKCEEDVDKPERSFGTVSRWDPTRPFDTAHSTDWLTVYMNTAVPVGADECLDCVWLPLCNRGCPNRRLAGESQCLSYKDRPQEYVLARYEYLKERCLENEQP